MINKNKAQTNRKTKKTIIQKSTNIVCLYLIYKSRFLIFERDDGIVGPLSGKVESGGELYISAMVRELEEETAIRLYKEQIHLTPHSFFGAKSPKGKILCGQTYYASLESNKFKPSNMKFNSELFDYKLLTTNEAIKIIKRFGHQESLYGLKCVANILRGQVK